VSLIDRRKFIKLLLAAGGLAALGGYVSNQLSQANSENAGTPQPPPNSHISDVRNYTDINTTSINTPNLTPVSSWYVIQIGQTPVIDVNQYALIIDGLVESPLRLTYEKLTSPPSVRLGKCRGPLIIIWQ